MIKPKMQMLNFKSVFSVLYESNLEYFQHRENAQTHFIRTTKPNTTPPLLQQDNVLWFIQTWMVLFLGFIRSPVPPPPEGRLWSRVNHYIPPLAPLIAHILKPKQQSIRHWMQIVVAEAFASAL